MKFLLFFSVVLIALPAISQNTLTVNLKDGQTFNYCLDKKPVVTYSETDIVLTTDSAQVTFQLTDLAKFTFTEAKEETSVKGPVSSDTGLSLTNGTVSISGARPGDTFSIASADGKIVASFKADADGKLSFSTSGFAAGVYIIHSSTFDCKILKR